MKRIISSENWFNYVVLFFFFFFFENVKNLGRLDDAKQRQKKTAMPCVFFPVDRCLEGGVGVAF